MNEFEKRIKVDTPVIVKGAEKVYNSQGRNMDITEKVVTAVYTSILSLVNEETDKDKKIKLANHLNNLSRIARYYEEPEFIDLTYEFFDRLKRKHKGIDDDYMRGK